MAWLALPRTITGRRDLEGLLVGPFLLRLRLEFQEGIASSGRHDDEPEALLYVKSAAPVYAGDTERQIRSRKARLGDVRERLTDEKMAAALTRLACSIVVWTFSQRIWFLRFHDFVFLPFYQTTRGVLCLVLSRINNPGKIRLP